MPFQLSPGVNVTEIDLTSIVPAVATTTGAIAGVFNSGPIGERILIDNETKLISTFGYPTANNAETWFTAANFLSYGNSLYVVRVADSYSAYANVGSISTSNPTISNITDYENKTVSQSTPFPSDTTMHWMAKNPGVVGNSLKVSVCDTAADYSSTLYANGLASSLALDVIANLSITIGSSTSTLTVTPGGSGTVLQANTYAANYFSKIKVGDYITVGNASIGTQLLQVSAKGSVSADSLVSTGTLTFTSPYRLSTNFTTSGTINNTTTRQWEYSTAIGTVPGTTDYQSTSTNPTVVDEIHVVVVDNNGAITGTPGTILEAFTNMSRAIDASTISGASNYYKTVINQGSKYIWWINDETYSASALAASLSNSTRQTTSYTFSGASTIYTETTVPLATLATAYDLFASAESIDVSFILQGKPRGGTTSVNGQSVSNFQLANYLIDNIAEIRKDCIVLISPDDAIVRSNPGNEAGSIVNWRGAVHDSSYAVMDTGYKYQYDRYNDIYRYVPMNGDIAGICVRTDNTRDPWWSPAGFNRGQLKNLVKLRYNPSKADRDTLYKNGINPVVTFPGQGTVLFGDKTLQTKPSAFDHINVRRLFIVLEKAIATAAKFFLFEFNDDFTRAQFKALVQPYLRDIQGRRGITDYLVVCDSTNNTAEVIDGNKFIGDIYIKPARSINYIQLNFVAVRTGVQFSEIVGKF